MAEYLNKMSAKEIVAAFLSSIPSPTKTQWKLLIEQHKEVAGYITDAAIRHSRAQHLTEEDVEAPLNDEAFNSSVSKAINLVHTTPSPINTAIENRVSQIRGAAVRKVAAELGLAASPALLSSVLVGNVTPAKTVLSRLAERLDTSAVALQVFFRICFESQHVPAFKATQGKPQVSVEPVSWADAVRALKLTPEQTKELLDLDA